MAQSNNSHVWSWSRLCEYGEDFQAWEDSDFGHCFEQLAILSPSHVLLALVSSYHFGRRRRSFRGTSLYVRWTWFLVVRFICAIALFLSPAVQIIVSVWIERSLPSVADGVQAGLAFLSWTLHACYVWNLRYLHKDSLRGPISAIVSVFIVVASCDVHTFTVIKRHLSDSPHQLLTEEISTYFNAAVCLVYISSLIPNKNRIYHGELAFAVNTDDDSESEPVAWDRLRSYSTIPHQGEEPIIAESHVGCLSWLTFHWVQSLMSRGASMNIHSVEDLYQLPHRLNTKTISNKFEKTMTSALNIRKRVISTESDFDNSYEDDSPESFTRVNQHQSYQNEDYSNMQVREESNENDLLSENQRRNNKKTNKISLFRIFNKTFGLEYYSLGILKLLADCLGFAGPVLLNYLVTFIESTSEPLYHGYLYVAGLFLSTFLGTVCSTQFDYNVQVLAYKVRCALVSTVYRKSLTISGVAHAEFTSGQIVNFMSTDSDRILNLCPSFHAFWSLPFQVAVSLYLLYQQVGLAFLAGLTFALILIPINRSLANKIGQLSTEMMQHKDDRVKLMGEILSGIRVVKLHAWETHFAGKVAEIRQQELRCLQGRKYLDALCVYFWATTPVLISILTFGTYVMLGHTLTAAKVFTSLSLFVMLIGPLNAFPWVLNGLVEAWVSLQRVTQFVCLPDMKPGAYYSPPAPADAGSSGEPVIKLTNASFSWRSSGADNKAKSLKNVARADDESPMNLQDLIGINLNVHKGELIGVVGRVGAGKSSLLSAILGELQKIEGEICINDLDAGFAYVSQEPWLQQATIRDNILFGRPFESERYSATLEACALIEDIKAMVSGDMTEVGDNGVTLSGGQRARVALARAVYQDKCVYLLDDPLSAVDVHVGEHLLTQCVMGLLHTKTRVLCTHQLQFLTHADWVIVLEEGKVIRAGPPSDVLPQIQPTGGAQRKSGPEEKEGDMNENKGEEEAEKLIEEEEKEKGVLKADVFKNYWLAVGTCLSPFVLLSLFFMQASRNISDWWLAYWVNHSNEVAPGNPVGLQYLHKQTTIPDMNLTGSSDNLNFYLGIYGGLAASNSIFTLLRAFLFAFGGIRAAKVIHTRLLKAILRAPMSFFDSTPLGRLLNRFSSDLYALDDSLPFILNIFLAQAFGILGTIVVTCLGLPWFAVSLVPIGAVYFKIQHYYRHTSRELKRLSSVSLSPIYCHFTETITGLTTIRAMRHSARFCKENVDRLDVNQRAQYATQMSARWLDFRLRMLGVAMVTCLSLVAVLQHQLSSVDSGLVGLAISYALAVTNLLGGVVMFFTETEKEFVSVERCQQYIQDTPSERWDGSLFPPSLWPTNGVLEFDDVSLRYSQTGAPALKGVSFRTEPGEKVGIVGRTGAGKSSLFLALFRLAEISTGQVVVDGVGLGMLDLTDVRSKLAIIPQDPFLFSGTIRLNLDPTGVHSDPELWAALERCHLQDQVKRMGGLGAKVTQRGREFSVGQRQLLCLARALLCKAKVVCIDEATASVDHETDKLIQATIRQELHTSTVLTIAHRINTVLDSNRVLVMREGRVAEFAPPDDLLNDSESLFYQLVHGRA